MTGVEVNATAIPARLDFPLANVATDGFQARIRFALPWQSDLALGSAGTRARPVGVS
jgi:hypothetical protein